MNIIEKINKNLKKIFKELGFDEEYAVVTFSDRPELCDFQCNAAFALAKKERQAPMLIANKIAEKIDSRDFDVSVVAPGFVNITLNEKQLSRIMRELFDDERVGIEKKKKSKIILDYGGPNVAKPLHVGHLRSAIIGETLKRLAVFMGDEVIGDVHIGDWGLQMGLTIASILEKYDCQYYFFGQGKKLQLTMDELNTLYPQAVARAKIDEDFKRKAQEYTVRLQNKEKGYYDIWKEIRRISIDAIKEDYKKLNVSFDLWCGESDAAPYIEKTFDILNSKKLIEKSEGAEIVRVEMESDASPMPPVIVRSSAGAELYATTDIATIVSRVEKFDPEEMWYLTDSRQSTHFEQVFRVCRFAGIVKKSVRLVHLPFGTMNGPDGKPFKTRAGGTMRLSDFINLTAEACEKKLRESEKVSGLSEKKLKELALKIGISAIKFGDMINYLTKDYIFDVPKFCAFEGKTGPYMLYSIVRINSILKKAGNFTPTFKVGSQLEKDIIINLLKFASDVKTSYFGKAPSIMIQSAYNLAASFSVLYNQTKILSENDFNRRNSLLTLLAIVKKALVLFSHFLAVDIPEKM
jgi:arginyl-tRNA synthetase